MYLFFDELQQIDAWEDAVNSFRVVFNCDIYNTASNAYLLSSGYSTYLSGDTWRLRCCHSLFGNFLISTTSVCGRLVVPWEGHADRGLIKVENVMICGRYLMPICVLTVCRESQIANILLGQLAHSSGRMDLK